MKTLESMLDNYSFIIGNHSVHLRLLTQRDMELWMEFVNSCSPRSLWLRFLSPFSATPENARRFCNINPDEEIAVAAEITEGEQKRLIAVARLIKCIPRDHAEYAVIVTDSYQQKKLGLIMSKTCISLAKNLDIRIVNAETIRENFPIIRVLDYCQFKLKNKEKNMIQMSLRLD